MKNDLLCSNLEQTIINLTSYEFPEVSDVFALFNSLPNNSRRYYNILSPINTPLTTQGLFYISRVSADYGKIEYRPLSKSIVYLNTKMAGVWQGWDQITLNSDLRSIIKSNIKSIDYTWDNNSPKLIVTDANGVTFYTPLTRK